MNITPPPRVLFPIDLASVPTAQETLGRIVRAAHDGKFAAAAREIASRDISLIKLTGPPVENTTPAAYAARSTPKLDVRG